jgi:hypothetical protein
MTSLALLLWIVSGIVLQLAIYLGIGFWRHWHDYQALRHRAAEFNLPVAPPSACRGRRHSCCCLAGVPDVSGRA